MLDLGRASDTDMVMCGPVREHPAAPEVGTSMDSSMSAADCNQKEIVTATLCFEACAKVQI